MKKYLLSVLLILIIILGLNGCNGLPDVGGVLNGEESNQQEPVSEPQDQTEPETEVEESDSAVVEPTETLEIPDQAFEEDQASDGALPKIVPDNIGVLIKTAETQVEYPYRLIWTSNDLLAVLNNESVFYLTQDELKNTASVQLVSPVRLLDVSNNGRWILTTEDQQSIQIRDVQDGRIVNTFTPERQFQNAVFLSDNESIAHDSVDVISVHIVDVLFGNELKELSGFTTAAPVYGFSFSRDNSVLIWIARGSIQPMNVQTAELGTRFSHEDFIMNYDVSPDNQILAVASAGTIEGTIKPIIFLYDIATGLEIDRLVQEEIMPMGLEFSPDGKLLAAGLESKVVFWNMETMEQVGFIETNQEGVSTMAFSPNGDTLAVATYDGFVSLWQIQQ